MILSNIGNTREEFEYLINSLKDISSKKYDVTQKNVKIMPLIDPEIVMNLREAYFAPKESIDKFEAIGRISSEVVALCPPGISILLPGEIIKKEHLPYLFSYDKIEVTLPKKTVAPEFSLETQLINNIKNLFLGCGFYEAVNSSLIGEPLLKEFSLTSFSNSIMNLFRIFVWAKI